jgi:prolyl-tRNA editing enzyme YbaK/EbsC (Cys-tRNA(Pro) deacylase)
VTTLDHPAVRVIAAALRARGMTGAADGIRFLHEDMRTAAAAAAALGVDVGAIANSLVFAADHGGHVRPLLVLTSGAHRADPARLAALTGADSVGRADPAFVRAHTGHAIGGVGPLGHPAPLRTLVDTALAAHPVVWAAAGHPKSLFPTTYADLLALTGGTAAAVAAGEDDSVP